MPKVALTVGDICKIKDILAEKRGQEDNAAKKEEIAGLIKKLENMKVGSKGKNHS